MVPRAEQESWHVQAAARGQRQPETLKEMVVWPTASFKAEKVFHLIEHEERARAHREADDHAVRHVARHVAQAEEGDAELGGAHQECHQHRG